MANLHSRIQEASKEELAQILKAVCSFTDTHYHVESVLDYLDDKKQSEAAAAAKRRLSTRRASLSNKSWAQLLPKTVKRNIKMCKLCELPFVEKENTNESCLYHWGKWLLECENEHEVWFADLDKAGEEFTSNKDAMCIIDCCNSQRGASKGCVKRKHVALVR